VKLESTIKERAGFLYLAPLLDGVLLLLVFFVCSSSFVLKSGVQIELPASLSSLKSSRNSHIIIMEGNPAKIYFNESRVDAALLDRRFQEGKVASNHVIILADQHTAYGEVMAVALRALNYHYEVAFGTRPSHE